jgi:hypothetical protein
MKCLKILSQYLPAGTEENYKNPLPGYLAPGKRSNLKTSKYQGRHTNYPTMILDMITVLT